jgi:hypothetical protein
MDKFQDQLRSSLQDYIEAVKTPGMDPELIWNMKEIIVGNMNQISNIQET